MRQGRLLIYCVALSFLISFLCYVTLGLADTPRPNQDVPEVEKGVQSSPQEEQEKKVEEELEEEEIIEEEYPLEEEGEIEEEAQQERKEEVEPKGEGH